MTKTEEKALIKPIKKLTHFLHNLYNYDRLFYAYNFFRQFFNKKYFEDKNPAKGCAEQREFLFRTLGEMNKDVAIYLIKFDMPTSGLMATLACTTIQLAVADVFGFTPVIEWKNLFFERDYPGQDGDNIFEYYFKQPCGISVEDAMESYHVATVEHHYEKSVIPFGPHNLYRHLTDEKILYTKAFNRFITLNQFTKDSISMEISNITKGNTLGVHVRGGGYEVAKCKHHPIPISTSEYISEVKNAIDAHGFDNIFLATGSDDVILDFKNEFGGMVKCYNDITRIAPGAKSDWIYLANDGRGSRTDHVYKMGLEVLKDTYTLAKCSGIIGSMSNVSNIAQWINGGKYIYSKVIDKGIHGIDKFGKTVPVYDDEENKMLEDGARTSLEFCHSKQYGHFPDRVP